MSGVTLIELMVTLAIAAIMLSMAVPSFQTFIRTSHVRTVTDELVAVFNFSRSEAVKRGWPVTVCKSNTVQASAPACNTAASWKDGWLVFVDVDQNGSVGASDTLLKVGKPATDQLAISGGTNFSNYLTYLPSGSSLGNGGAASGTVTVCLEGVQRAITVNNTGRLRIDARSC